MNADQTIRAGLGSPVFDEFFRGAKDAPARFAVAALGLAERALFGCRGRAAMLCRPPLFGRYAPSSLRPPKHRKTSRLQIYRRDVALTRKAASSSAAIES